MEDKVFIFNVLVVPNSKLNKLIEYSEGVLKVKLSSLPVKGQANKALIRFLAQKLKVSQKSINILSGDHSRKKRVEICGLENESVLTLLKEEGLI